jgi:hypothetical protein
MHSRWVASQTWPRLGSQEKQGSPSVPQNWFVVPGRQVVTFSQQPSGQLSPLQTQVPRNEPQEGVVQQSCPLWHVTHGAPPRPQVWSVSPARQTLLASQQPFGQVWGVQRRVPWHCPSSPHVAPAGHWPLLGPQVPPLPQPSGPHSRPVQFGAQHNPDGLHSVAPGRQHVPSQQCPEAGPLAAHWLLGSGPSLTML